MKFKLKEKTKKAIRGSISILMVIILLPMMTFSAVIVDTSRINMAKQMISGAGDLTMNTALANYDTILKDVYGLFAMSQEKSEAQLEEDLKKYFADTISGYGVVSEAEAGDYVESLLGDFRVLLADTGKYQNDQLTNFLKLDALNLKADRVNASALANSSILRNQIVEYMKFRAPLSFGMSFIDALKSFDVADEQMDVVEVQVKAQESTEDVATACKKLIDLIREYDELIVKINSGESVVTGLKNSTDGTSIPIKDYDTQIDKYLTVWDEDYTHINKLMMVFLAKAPTVDDVCLVKQDFANGVYFIKADGSGVVYDNSGITVSVSTSGSTSGAKTQVNNQIATLNGLKGKADTYKGKTFIDKSYVDDKKTMFINESGAISKFIEYEKFLKDQLTDVKYSEIENVLQQIYILGKYYDNYDAKIAADIKKTEKDLGSAKTALENINKTINGIAQTLGGYVTNINSAAQNYAGDKPNFSFLSLKASSYKATAEKLLGNDLPALGTDFEGYYNTNLVKYENLLKNVATQFKNKGSKAEKAIADGVLQYLSSGKQTAYNNAKKNLSTLEKLTVNKQLEFYDCLITIVGLAKGFSQEVTNYNNALQQKATAEQNVQNLQTQLDNQTRERSDMATSYKGCLNNFKDFVKAYQSDAYYYGSYITTATNVVDRETAAISTQFGKICSNIDALTQKLDAIKKQCGTAKTQIDAYLLKVDSWETKNNDYVKANGEDSFSKQIAADIATARSTYDVNSLVTLQTFVTEQYTRFNNFYTYLQGDVYFKYGGKRLHEIKSAADAKSAAKSNIDSISAEVITAEMATTSLGQLFKGGPGTTFKPYTMEIARTDAELAGTAAADNQGQLCFLEPVTIQIQFLKYLNSAYTETKPEYAEGEDPEANYEKTEEELKNPDPIGEKIEEKKEETNKTDKDENKDKNDKNDKKEESTEPTLPKTDKYGYSHKNVSISDSEKSKLPSHDKVESSEAGNGAFKLDSTSEKASGSIESQGSALDTILTGLGDALTAGVENAYILTYIFENFSYNTLIQDAVMEGQKGDLNGNGLANLASAKTLLKNKDTLNTYKDTQKTLSGIKRNAANNYLYGAEIEYILFGNTNTTKNVNSMKASVYAIRFAFNCIYAFTNAEIRNTTMSAGLAVQAATLGVVPYQVVQIVLQLALAAAESALDLDMMMSGLDVAVVKTKDTWMLSVSTAVKAAGTAFADAAADAATKGINAVAGGLQKVVDVSADKLSGAIKDVQNDLQNAAEKAVSDTVDSIFGVVTNKLEAVLNEMQFAELNTKEAAKTWFDGKVATAKTEITTELNKRFGTSDIGKKVLQFVQDKGYIDSAIKKVTDPVHTAITNAPVPSQAVECVLGQLNTIKMDLVNEVTGYVNEILEQASGWAETAVADVKKELDGYITETSQNLSEEASNAIREKVSNATNDFVENTLSKVDTTVDGGSGGSSLASMFKFGYKEYLMLFVYVAICAGGTAENNKILLRTADVIQLNVCHATEGLAAYTHKKGENFRMKNACTYISITAEAELDMFFMDMDLFAAMVEEEPLVDENGAVIEKEESGTVIKYKGLLGY